MFMLGPATNSGEAPARSMALASSVMPCSVPDKACNKAPKRNICGVCASHLSWRARVNATRPASSACLSVSGKGKANSPPTPSATQALTKRRTSAACNKQRAASCTMTQSSDTAPVANKCSKPARTEAARRASELLTWVGLAGYESRRVNELSGGQAQRVWLAMVLAQDADIILLDEPTSGVSVSEKYPMMDTISEALGASDVTVLFVEHDMHMVRHIADWVVVMAEGKVVAEGPPETVMKEQAVIDAYLGAHQETDLGEVTGRINIIKGEGK